MKNILSNLNKLLLKVCKEGTLHKRINAPVIKKLSVRASISCFEYYYAIDLGKGVFKEYSSLQKYFQNLYSSIEPIRTKPVKNVRN